MASIAGQEDTFLSVKAVGNSLANGAEGSPIYSDKFKLERRYSLHSFFLDELFTYVLTKLLVYFKWYGKTNPCMTMIFSNL